MTQPQNTPTPPGLPPAPPIPEMRIDMPKGIPVGLVLVTLILAAAIDALLMGLIVLIRPDLTQGPVIVGLSGLLTLIVGTGGALLQQQKQTHVALNGRLTQLLEMTRTASHAAGVVQGQNEGTALLATAAANVAAKAIEAAGNNQPAPAAGLTLNLVAGTAPPDGSPAAPTIFVSAAPAAPATPTPETPAPHYDGAASPHHGPADVEATHPPTPPPPAANWR